MIDRATAKQYAGHWSEPHRPLFDPSKDELRPLLAEAGRNTVAIAAAQACNFGEGEV